MQIRSLAAGALGLTLVVACSGGATVDDTSTAPGADAAPTTGGAAAPADRSADGSMTADDIPVAHTPPGGWQGEMPAPILAGCDEPLVAGAPDLRGMWQVVAVEVGGEPAPAHPALGKAQRVEQCGDRLVVTAGGIIHDMRVDGTEANGVRDVAEMDYATPITVVATYEDGVHVLRPVGLPLEVTRRRDGDQMIWTYVGFTARLDRVGPPDAPPPPETA